MPRFLSELSLDNQPARRVKTGSSAHDSTRVDQVLATPYVTWNPQVGDRSGLEVPMNYIAAPISAPPASMTLGDVYTIGPSGITQAEWEAWGPNTQPLWFISAGKYEFGLVLPQPGDQIIYRSTALGLVHAPINRYTVVKDMVIGVGAYFIKKDAPEGTFIVQTPIPAKAGAPYLRAGKFWMRGGADELASGHMELFDDNGVTKLKALRGMMPGSVLDPMKGPFNPTGVFWFEFMYEKA